MPNYQPVPILTKIREVVAMHEKSPLDPGVARAAVEKILKTYCKLGVENARLRLDYVTEARESCKKTLAEMERLLEELKSPNYIPEPYKLSECKAGRDVIQLRAEAVHRDGTQIYDLMSEFRSSWEPTVQKVCADSAFVATYIAIRTHTMTMGKQAVAQSERLDEYLKRAELVVKQAELARKGGEQATKQMLEEAEGLAKELEANALEISKLAQETEAKGKSLASHLKVKSYTGKDHKVCETLVADIETGRKGAAGRYKTSEKIETRLGELIAARSFMLGTVKKRKEAAMAEMLKDLKTLEGIEKDARETLKSLNERLFGKKK